MAIKDSLLPEFDHEIANTRKTLERVPENKFTWKPHPKSGSMIWLAGHIANLAGWAKETINLDSLDIAPPGQPPVTQPEPKTRKELLELFERNAAAGRAAIAGVSDERLMKPWSLLAGGKNILTLPRVAVLRGFVMNHLIHHRAQLCVYLRLNDVPVPALYGPSADEQGFAASAN
ncbi:MAG: DinB family protein [Candidatus Acidiferrales bacterium]